MFHKIPKRFSNEAMAADLKSALLYSTHLPMTVAGEIADIMGTDRRTVYDILDGRIRVSLDFLHAATIATHGEPSVKKYLEPEGFELHCSSASSTIPDGKTLAEECLDDVPALGDFHQVLNNPKSTAMDVKRAYKHVHDELRQNMELWAAERGVSL